jgi:hypothetical protein
MDETSFQIGVSKDQLVITKKKQSHYFRLLINRESVTFIKTIRGNSEVIPPFIILSGSVYMAKWYSIDTLDLKTSITMSLISYANDEISLAWLKHFDICTKDQTYRRAKLLIIDGYESHHTKQFIQYCEDNRIILFGLLLYLTYIL